MGLTRRPGLAPCAHPVHPHVRGAHAPPWPGTLCAPGPSPRAWGSPARPTRPHPQVRSIPTCVGLTAAPRPFPLLWTVHPHVRGAHVFAHLRLVQLRGPSPRAWGSPRGALTPAGCFWSIPTCVGLTPTEETIRRQIRVHPHVRGAHNPGFIEYQFRNGPSPRAWGSPKRSLSGYVRHRSIPTCVGLTAGHGTSPIKPSGPSPRAWGSRHRCVSRAHDARSIPTCVGLTVLSPTGTRSMLVHPHVRGAHVGLHVLDGAPVRSIPTCVGLT